MVNKFGILVVALLASPAIPRIASAVDNVSDEQVVLSIALSQQSAFHEEAVVLAEPTVVVTLGQPFSFHVGGKSMPTEGGEAMEIGTRLRGTITRRDADLLVALTLGLGRVVRDERNPEVEMVRTETLALRMSIAVDQKKRIDCGHSQTLEIHAVPAP